MTNYRIRVEQRPKESNKRYYPEIEIDQQFISHWENACEAIDRFCISTESVAYEALLDGPNVYYTDITQVETMLDSLIEYEADYTVEIINYPRPKRLDPPTVNEMLEVRNNLNKQLLELEAYSTRPDGSTLRAQIKRELESRIKGVTVICDAGNNPCTIVDRGCVVAKVMWTEPHRSTTHYYNLVFGPEDKVKEIQHEFKYY